MSDISARENLVRVLTRNNPMYVPYRRMDGSISGMVRIPYKDSRALLSGTDRWGVGWEGGIAATSEREAEIQGYPVYHPLKDLDEIGAFPFPDPDEPGIMDRLLDGVDRNKALVVGELCFPVQDRAHLLMGMEDFFVALLKQPEPMRELFHRITDYQVGIVQRYLSMGVDIIRALDDYGGQASLLMGPKLWRALIKPELARIVAAAKQGGAWFWLHSCGHIMEILPDLIEIGVDILDPLQARANDQALAKRLYGDQLCIVGGIDTQQVLTLGTPEQIESEVQSKIRILGPGGGFILAPDTLLPVPERELSSLSGCL